MMKRLAIAFFLVMMMVVSNTSSASTINWYTVTGSYLYDDSGLNNTELSVGDLVQLIVDMGGDGLDSIEFTGSSLPADDDLLLPITGLDSNPGAIGDNLGPPPHTGRFSETSTYDGSSYGGKTVYIRFWDSPAPAIGDHYGEWTVGAVLGSGDLQATPAFIGASDWTDTTLIPEPGSLLLMGIGILGLMVWIRKQRTEYREQNTDIKSTI